MSNYEADYHWRATAPDGALSPGSSATGSPQRFTTTDADGRIVEFPHAEPAPANPEALIEGGRVTGPRDMESTPPPEPAAVAAPEAASSPPAADATDAADAGEEA